MLELKEMLERKERISLRKSALNIELGYLNEEEDALDTLIKVYKTRTYDPIEEERVVTEHLKTDESIGGYTSTLRMKSAIEEIVRTMGPVSQSDIATLLDRAQSTVSRVIKLLVDDDVVSYTTTRPRKYTIK